MTDYNIGCPHCGGVFFHTFHHHGAEEITVTLTKQFAMDLWMYLDAKLEEHGWTSGPLREHYQAIYDFKELLADLCRDDENADH